MQLPVTVIHADWSAHPKKRWASKAHLIGDRYMVEAPAQVTPAGLLSLLRAPATMVGFDFPIGVPRAYGRTLTETSFLPWLRGLGHGAYKSFFQAAQLVADIDHHRPFYPHAAYKGASPDHIVSGLKLSSRDDLFRRCEIAQGRQACALFWTLGGNQVGKGALSGWKEVIIPAMDQGAAIWPFAGGLADLLMQQKAVIVETYPGDVYGYVGATLPLVKNAKGGVEKGKTSQLSRRAGGGGMLRWAQRAGVDLSVDLADQIRDGFGSDKQGEDRFDAAVGVLGMIAVLKGLRDEGVPNEADARCWEGWILGRLP